jgi:hypothetical protein
MGWQKQLVLFFEPLLGAILATFGTVSIAARVIAEEVFLTTGVLALICPAAHHRGATVDNVLNRPDVTGQHAVGETVQIFRSMAEKDIRQLDHGPGWL